MKILHLTRCFPAALLMAAAPTESLHGTPQAASWRGQSITEFAPEESGRMGWQIVNDGVMGGLSKGEIALAPEGVMTFSGTLSLDNNGGFTTVRSEKVEIDLSNDLGILLRVKGDGRTYEVRLDSDARFRGMPVSFAGKFETVKGKWQQVKVPFASFQGSFRGTDLPGEALNPAAIERIGILLADKRPGPFLLEVDWIRTYGKGQGQIGLTEGNIRDVTSGADSAPRQSLGLIATAERDGRFRTFKKALDAAGLTPFFQWDNPLTVFAPTNDAFDKLPDGVLDELLKPESKERLITLLSRHVSAGSTKLADAIRAESVKPVRGEPLKVAFSEGRVRVNEAILLEADIEARDGVIHAIDTVLLPNATN